MMMMIYETTPEFLRDFKKLSKKYPSLIDDLQVAKKNAIELLHIYKLDNNSIVELKHTSTSDIKFYKLRKFACKSLKGTASMSGIRLIYARHIHNEVITLLEIYSKANQSNEDTKRIQKYRQKFEPNINHNSKR